MSLCELVVGGKDGLQPIEKTVIDRCVRLIYRDMALGLGDGKPPLLQDFIRGASQTAGAGGPPGGNRPGALLYGLP